ncbi:AAA family ATPase [Membranicola marinus]|uniref:AAA family ATPase n=1 Tax=Membranihabitans marinus TaxID=1227546 RepID=A0A953HPI0_9BACT|nr:AAA family ATPase [Membranihabitans marinus]MBY5959814.1 AAA family ATPase [Membranihabitans marinus]
MERLKKISNRRQEGIPTGFHRYLFSQINWNQRLIIILGQRGTGKTTLLLQKMNNEENSAIYLSLDDVYFEANRLVILADELYEQGYRHFYLDEVHRYPHWSKDVKNIYDSYPDINIILTGSSILDIRKGQGDLSRRATIYHLYGLSFREFLQLEYNITTDTIDLDTLVSSHNEQSAHFTDLMNPLKLYREYLKYGYYPFYKEVQNAFGQKLLETIDLVLELDIAPYDRLNYSTIRNMKKLVYVLSKSVPFIPNISKLAKKLDTSRNTLLKLLDSLDQARIVSLLRRDTKGVSYLQKPEKIYLQNPNLAYWLSESNPNSGNMRETFFYSQLEPIHQVTSARYGDFLIDDQYVFEIGGPSKTREQIRGLPNAWIAADGIKGGTGNKIPLWLFGFLY